MQRNIKNQRRPQLDTLEPRLLMAGNVTVSYSSGNLVISGDNSSNSIEIYQPDLDHYRVVGRSSTRINGRSGRTFDFYLNSSRYTRDIQISMKGGNDSVYIHGGSGFFDIDAPDDIRVDMGSGTDRVDLRNVQAQGGDVLINMGSGTGTVFATDVNAADDFRVTSSLNAKVTANINRVIVGDQLEVDLSDSTDKVNINDSSTSELIVALWGANDKLSVKRTWVWRSSDLDGGKGNDDLNLFVNVPLSLNWKAFKSPTSLNINY